MEKYIELENIGEVKHFWKRQCKPIVMYDLSGKAIKTFESSAAAARYVKGHYVNIISCANHPTKNKTSYGYQWRWLEQVKK